MVVKSAIFATSGPWLILAAAMLWGTTGTSQALAPEESTPASIAALRMLIGGTVLALYTFLRGRLRMQSWPIPLSLFAGGLIALYQVSIFWAMSKTGVAVGTIVGMGSSPVFAGILEYLFRRRGPKKRWYLSTGLAILGSFLLVVSSRDLQIDILGINLALLAGFSYASYTLTIKLLVKNHSPEDVTTVVTSIGAFFLLPVLLRSNLEWLGQINGWLMILHLGVFATAFSYLLFAKGLASVPASTGVTLTLAEPLVAAVLGILVVGERVGAAASLGLIVIFLGLLLLVLPGRSDLITK